MVSKDALLDMLKKSLSLEDGFISEFTEKKIGLIDECDEIEPEEKAKMKDTIKVLLTDTQRHADEIADLIETIEESSKNEY